jgi:hypothetical protein
LHRHTYLISTLLDCGNRVGNSPKDENQTMPEWTRLKGCPYDERLQLIWVSGNVSEFETRLGYRYRCVIENGARKWFSFRTNQPMKRATRAEVKICCRKLQRHFGTFVDRPNGAGPVRIFPKGSGITGLLSSGISFCPWCGRELEFMEEETVESRVRTAKA